MKILIVEDNSAAALTVSTILKLAYEKAQIEVCESGYCALNYLQNQKGDLIILDLGLPDISGFDVLKEIRAVSAVPIVVLTAREEEENVLKALEMGADEYIIKPFRHLEFLARVKKALGKNGVFSSSGVFSFGNITVNGIKSELSLNDKSIILTRVESLIMCLLVQYGGETVSYRQIADAIWNHLYPGAEESIRVYISRLRSKIEQAGWKNTIHICSATGVGYLLAVDDE